MKQRIENRLNKHKTDLKMEDKSKCATKFFKNISKSSQKLLTMTSSIM